MISEISIAYSWWSILLVVLLGFIYAGLLYVKNPLNRLSGRLSVLLFVLRFITVSFLGFLLLSPILKTKKKLVEKPIVIVGRDNSGSILMTKDSIYYSTEMDIEIKKLVSNLSKKSEVESYLFGSVVRQAVTSPDYNDNFSNYSDFLSYVKQNYTGLNVGAIILVGDGIVNNGIDPVFASADINYPIFTVALGDTSKAADVKIDDVRFNSIVYSNDRFPIEVSISANKLKGNTSVVSLYNKNKLIAKKVVKFTNSRFRKTIKFYVDAKVAGKQHYKIVVQSVVGEISTENNLRNIFVDVVASKQKILILAYAPHPDIGAIKQSLMKNKNYSVVVKYAGNFNGDVKKYNLIILHELPAIKNSAINILKKIKKYKIPVLYVLGNQSNLPVFNKFNSGLSILSSTGSTIPAQFRYNTSFPYFAYSKEFASQMATLPPLNVQLGNYKPAIETETIGWQVVNGVVTDFPLISFYSNMGLKSGVISGEGIWLWRIQSFLQYNNSSAVDALLNKAAMFLIANTDKRHFIVHSKGEYESNKDIVVSAELYNQTLKPDNTPDVVLLLTNEDGKKYDFTFSPFGDYYKLNLNKLPVGAYSYSASTKLGNDVYKDNGEFIVQKPDIESRDLVANHGMLNRLSQNHNGAMYQPHEINKLLPKINSMQSMKVKIHYQDKFIGLSSLLFVIIGILILLVIEWFLRKYFGDY